MSQARVLAFVMAGGQGTRLRPFTEAEPKPALPFGGGYRLVDFVLSNLFNSMLPGAHVLLEYRPRLLVRHLAAHWGAVRGARGRFVHPLLPDDLRVPQFYGTAGAVDAALQVIDSVEYDLIAVFAADHVYRMDVRQMTAFHRERDADATIAAVPVPLERANAFGIICAGRDGRILGFQEKPRHADAMPSDPRRAYASMGNYLFRPEVLRAILAAARARGEHDFGHHVLPRLVDTHRVYAYDFEHNVVPGVQPGEEPAYWRDVGTIDAYVDAQWDLLGPAPRFRLANPEWPILCGDAPSATASIARDVVRHSIVGPNVPCAGAALRRSVLQQGSAVGAGAELERCIVMSGARIERDVQLHDAIVGGGNTLQVEDITRRRNPHRVPWERSPAGMLIVPPRRAARQQPRGHQQPRGQVLL